MRKIVFDIETQNTFAQVGSSEVTALDISLVGLYDSETDEYSSFLIDELDKMWPIFEKADMLIGYNSNHFDTPLLNKYYMGDLMQIKSLDILEKVKEACGKRLKLDQIAAATLGTKKSGHGLEAVSWWKQGEIEKIRKYCIDDVRITKDVYDFAMENGFLKYTTGFEELTMKIDTSDWEKKDGSAITQSLF